MQHLIIFQFTVDEGKLTFVANLGNAGILSISIIMTFITRPVFEADITRADWLIVGHYSLVMPKGRINPLYTSYAYTRNLFLALHFFHIIFTEDVYELTVTRAILYAAQQRSQKALFEFNIDW